MNKKIIVTILALYSSFSVSNTAGPFACNVDLQNVLLYTDGAVNVMHTGRSDFTYICNLNSERQGVSITTCALWASMLIGAQNEGKKVTFYYNGTASYNSCATLPTYGASPAPVYVGTTNL